MTTEETTQVKVDPEWQRVSWFKAKYGLSNYLLDRFVAEGKVATRKFDDSQSAARWYNVKDVAKVFAEAK